MHACAAEQVSQAAHWALDVHDTLQTLPEAQISLAAQSALVPHRPGAVMQEAAEQDCHARHCESFVHPAHTPALQPIPLWQSASVEHSPAASKLHAASESATASRSARI
jgi:hypothetical protein